MIVVVMGVAGAGKTTVGRLLARHLAARFADADDFHPPENVAKMRAGVALDDADRAPWLARLNALVAASAAAGEPLVLACSALKRAYRERLADGVPGVRFVFLDGPRELLARRLAGRTGHYMNPDLLDSQLATLERPEGAIVLAIDAPPETIACRAFAALAAGG
ncbi:MAG: gluconokinase [Burkholderiales bacterium]|nr:gluconokinase [Burkholderiales bacterium]